MTLMSVPVWRSPRFFACSIGLSFLLVILTACEPEQSAPQVTAPSPATEITTEANTNTAIVPEINENTDTASDAAIPQSSLQISKLSPVPSDTLEIEEIEETNESKLDPSVSYLNQQSDPIEIEQNLSILKQDSFDADTDKGNLFKSLQPKIEDEQDEIDSAIEWIFNGNVDAPLQSEQTSPILSPSLTQDDITSMINDGFDYDSLENVFAIISKPEIDDNITLPIARFPPKKASFTRAAILLPLSGTYKSIGEELRQAVDMAVISLDRNQFEVIYIDTADAPAEAANAAIDANADIIIGPVFSNHTAVVAPIAAENQIPVLSFSNNSTVTRPGVWIMGQQPEQEMETVLSYAMASLSAIDNIPPAQARIAIVTNDTAYGRTLRDSSIKQLELLGATQLSHLLLDQSVLENESRLQQTIRRFARWSKEDPTPEFDMVIICGDADFTLSVAPVLVWHDLDPAKVRFVGSSQWNRMDMITEPSLQGGLFATIPTDRSQRFEQVWKTHFKEKPSDIASLGFDAVAVASLITTDIDVDEVLLRDKGFAGFSGVFRFYPNGSNRRHLEVRQINSFRSMVIRPADKAF